MPPQRAAKGCAAFLPGNGSEAPAEKGDLRAGRIRDLRQCLCTDPHHILCPCRLRLCGDRVLVTEGTAAGTAYMRDKNGNVAVFHVS